MAQAKKEKRRNWSTGTARLFETGLNWDYPAGAKKFARAALIPATSELVEGNDENLSIKACLSVAIFSATAADEILKGGWWSGGLPLRICRLRSGGSRSVNPKSQKRSFSGSFEDNDPSGVKIRHAIRIADEKMEKNFKSKIDQISKKTSDEREASKQDLSRLWKRWSD